MKICDKFLPVTPEEVKEYGVDTPDFVYVCGDAYVDHPSFGAALISRVLEAEGYVVAMLPQPDYKSTKDFKKFGRPRLGFLVSGGNIDSMVCHYTAAKKKRSNDYYSPGGKAGYRPDRAVIVYCNRIREAYGDVPIIIGGLEASLRRCAHYDYWDNKVRRSILVDSRADILSYGMGEKSVLRIAALLNRGVPVKKIHDVRGTSYLCHRMEKVNFSVAGGKLPSGEPFGYEYDVLKTDKKAYADAFALQYRNNDALNGEAIVEYYGDRMLVQNPPMPPLEREELDRVYNIPFCRTYHPMYEKDGGIPAINEVKFSITHNRGCFGGCNFCAIAYHQGRTVRSRSVESVVEEAKLIASMPDFKGYIHDIGGPTANFRHAACKKQLTGGVCPDRRCLVPTPCKNLDPDHSEYIKLLSEVEKIPKVKKVFIRSGIRFDYMLLDKTDKFFKKLVRDHVSGQLKVAPEHCTSHVLSCMGKPDIAVYDRFREKFFKLSKECGKEQYLVPYLMSSHPGSRLEDAVELALYMKKIGLNPEQVQDFYPTPGTASTVMYYTGIDPMTGKEVYTATDYREKQMQRALLQYRRPENRNLVREALKKCGREDLIGYSPDCLVPPDGRKKDKATAEKENRTKNRPEKRTGNSAKSKGKNPDNGKKREFSQKTAPKNKNSSAAKKSVGGNAPRKNSSSKKAPVSRKNTQHKKSESTKKHRT
ncbi:MAG: YgiQ family radical SAM protein [Clostridia bacterium]|nr:YgiQ family radical SAM protein [Clostridia bacterium]